MRSCIFFFCSLSLILNSCVKDKIEDPAVDLTLEYFPLELGKYIVYAVDSIVFDDVTGGNVKDTATYQIREEVSDFQIDLTGDTVFYLHRYRREKPQDTWRVTDVWTTSRSVTEAVRTEENLKFRKMIFPLSSGKRWISTSYIPPATSVLIGTENVEAYQDWESKVLAIDIADQVGSFSFIDGDVIHISQTDFDDESIKRYVFEKYVRNLGLVSRTDSILDSRCFALMDFTPCIGKPWLENAGKGYILSQVMIDHN